MKVLLDTNALLWLLDGDRRLGVKAREAIQTAELLIVSEGSLWEISIKVSIGKLAPIPDLHNAIRELGFDRLGIADRHLQRLESLPLHHKDPFDRLLISQALSDNLVLLTADEAFVPYGVQVFDARI